MNLPRVYKILIIDDDEEWLLLYRQVLSSHGFAVLTVNNGAGGIKLAAEKAPDLILLDVVMPIEDGSEIAKKLSANTATKEIPLIFLTGIVTKEEVSLNQGVIGGKKFISKSAREDEVLHEIKKVLRIQDTP